MHWFNPPEWTPGIEVIAGPATDRAVVERVLEFLEDVGKQPAEVADRAGFVSNRLQMALLREALAIVAEGQTTREDLDTIVRSTFGFRLPFFGPFQIADMAGLDTYVGVYKTLERDVGPEFAPPAELREHVEAGRLGTKAGEGSPATPTRSATGCCSSATAATRRWRGCWRNDRRVRARGRRRRDRRRHRRQAHRRGAARGGARRERGPRRAPQRRARLDELGEERTVKIEAVTEPPDEEFDFVLVTLKAAHHEAVKPLKGTFVSLGNGLVQERLEKLVGRAT